MKTRKLLYQPEGDYPAMKKLLSSIAFFMICVAFQPVYGQLANTTLATDVDAELYQQLSVPGGRVSNDCGTSSRPCRYKAMQRFNNPRIEGANFKVDIELRAGQAPHTPDDITDTSFASPDNLLHVVETYIYHGGANGAFGASPFGALSAPTIEGRAGVTCDFVDRPAALNGPYTFTSNFNSGDTFPDMLFYGSTGSTGFGLPGSFRTLGSTVIRLPHDEWFRWITLQCTLPADAASRVAGVSFARETFKNTQQMIGTNQSSNYAVNLVNNLEYYPLDGTSAYIEHAEISDDARAAYIRFNEPFPAGHDVEVAGNYKVVPVTSTEAITATRAVRLGNRAVWLELGDGLRDSSPSTNTAVYINAGGFPSNYISASYDNGSTYRTAIPRGNVGLLEVVSAEASGNQIEVTFSEAVSGLQLANEDLTAADFTLEYYADGDSAARMVNPASVTKMSDTEYHLTLPSGSGFTTGQERLIVRGTDITNEGTGEDTKYYATNARIFSQDRKARVFPATANNADYAGSAARALFGNGLVSVAAVTLAAEPAGVTEGTPFTVTMGRAGDTSEEINVTVTASRPAGDSRVVDVNGTNWAANAETLSLEFTLAAGNTSADIVVTVPDDGDTQGNRTFTFTATGAGVLTNSLDVEVMDDDDAVAPVLPDNKAVVIAGIGPTRTTLRVTNAMDSDGFDGASNLRYYVDITDVADGTTIHSRVLVEDEVVPTNNGGEDTVVLVLNRANTMLLPGREYTIRVYVTDVGGNGIDENNMVLDTQYYDTVTLTTSLFQVTLNADPAGVTEGTTFTVTVGRTGDTSEPIDVIVTISRRADDSRAVTVDGNTWAVNSPTFPLSTVTLVPGDDASYAFDVTVPDDGDTQGNRTFTFTATGVGVARESLGVVVRDNDDEVPPTLPGDTAVTPIWIGATSATLQVTNATDSDGTGGASNLRYYIDIEDQNAGLSSQRRIVVADEVRPTNAGGANTVTLGLSRLNAVLIPERSYIFRVYVTDVGGNGIDAANGDVLDRLYYAPLTRTMGSVADNDADGDGIADDLPDTYRGVCSSRTADMDGDGVNDYYELRTGTDCRTTADANGFDDSELFAGSGPAPMLTVNNPVELLNYNFEADGINKYGEVVVLFNDPSTLPRVTCTGAGGSGCTLFAYDANELANCPSVGDCPLLRPLYTEDDTGEGTLAAWAGEDREIVWTMRDAKSNFRSAEQTVWVAPGLRLSGGGQVAAARTGSANGFVMHLFADGVDRNIQADSLLNEATPLVVTYTPMSLNLPLGKTRITIEGTVTEELVADESYTITLNPAGVDLTEASDDELRGISNEGASHRDYVTIYDLPDTDEVDSVATVMAFATPIPPGINALDVSYRESSVTVTYGLYRGSYSTATATADVLDDAGSSLLMYDSLDIPEGQAVATTQTNSFTTKRIQVVTTVTYAEGEIVHMFDYKIVPNVGVEYQPSYPSDIMDANGAAGGQGGFYEGRAHGSLGFPEASPGGVAEMSPVRTTPLMTSYYVYQDNAYCEFAEGPNAGALYSAESCEQGNIANAAPGLVTEYECIIAEVVDGGPNDPDGTKDGVVSLSAAVGVSDIAPPCGGPRGGAGGGGSADLWLLALLGGLAGGILWRNRQRRTARRRALPTG